jgi:hypothetical protein
LQVWPIAATNTPGTAQLQSQVSKKQQSQLLLQQHAPHFPATTVMEKLPYVLERKHQWHAGRQ